MASKNTFLLFFSILFSTLTYSQSIVLRPGVGIKFFNAKPDNSLSNNWDSTFDGKKSFSNLAVTASFEIIFPKGSYEVILTSQQVPTTASTQFKKAGISQSHSENGGITQFQFIYNKFLSSYKDSSKKISPFFGLGFGLGINRPSSFYDSSHYHSKFNSTTSPTDFIDYSQQYISLSKFSYSFIIKLGLCYKVKNIERVRIYGLYNLGLNKFVKSDIVYFHTNNKYYGSTTIKGSQFSLMITTPIYLKRQK